MQQPAMYPAPNWVPPPQSTYSGQPPVQPAPDQPSAPHPAPVQPGVQFVNMQSASVQQEQEDSPPVAVPFTSASPGSVSWETDREEGEVEEKDEDDRSVTERVISSYRKLYQQDNGSQYWVY